MIVRSSKVGIAGQIWLAALFAGCGGSSEGGGGSCGKVSPCGGSLVGTWTITSSCESVSNFTGGTECPGATIDESQIVTSGTLVFGADMTLTASPTIRGTRRFNVALACVEGVGSCDNYASLISPGPPDATTTCATAGSACNCTMVYAAPMTSVQAGTYSTAGNVLTVTAPGADPDEVGYCVQGNTLHMIKTDPATGAVVSDLVATK